MKAKARTKARAAKGNGKSPAGYTRAAWEKKPAGAGGGPAGLIATVSLDARSKLYLVRFAGKLLLLGSAGGALAKIDEVSDPEEVEKLEASAGRGGGEGEKVRAEMKSSSLVDRERCCWKRKSSVQFLFMT